MGKSSKPQVTTTNQVTEMPQYVQDAQKNLLGTGQSILAPYLNAGTSGYGVAGQNQDQLGAFQGVRDMAASAANGGGGITGTDIQGFLNPYTQSVVDTTNNTLRDQADQTINGIHAKAAAASSFGGSGSREALQVSNANKDLGTQIASTTAQLMAAGYDKATATALANKQMQTTTQQQSLQALLGIGNQQQAYDQTKLDVPLTALQRLLQITPQQYGSSTSGTQVAPQQNTGASGLQTALGVASTVASLFSDRDAKTDIKKLGKDPDTGLDLYAYRYKGDPKSYPKVVGPMAQDVEKKFPGSTRRVGGNLVITGG